MCLMTVTISTGLHKNAAVHPDRINFQDQTLTLDLRVSISKADFPKNLNESSHAT